MKDKKSKEEIVEFLNNCRSKEKAYAFFHIKQNMNGTYKNKELKKICEQYGFNLEDLSYTSYIKRQKEQYYKNPKRCLNCGKPISFERRLECNFCNNSCAASYNNLKRNPRSEQSRNKTSKSIMLYANENKGKEVRLLNGETTKVVKLRAVELYWNNELDFKTLKETFPNVIQVCQICGKEFVPHIDKKKTRLSRETTCSENCQSKLRSKRSKETYLKVKEEGRFKGWTTRKINSYAEKYWMKVLDNLNIPYIREEKFGRYFLDFKIDVGNFKLDLEIDGHQHTYRIEHDKERDAFLKQNGFIVYRIPWNTVNTENGRQLMNEKIDKFLEFYNSLKE